MMLTSSISLLYSFKFYYITRGVKTKMSPMLRIHQMAWVFFMCMTILYVLPVLAYWNLVGGLGRLRILGILVSTGKLDSGFERVYV